MSEENDIDHHDDKPDYDVLRTINGVSYVENADATDVEQTTTLVKQMENVYLILGGKIGENGLKGIEPVLKLLRHVFTYGGHEDDFSEWLEKYDIKYTTCGNIENAVNLAHSMAQSQRGLPGGGNTVLFSPSGTSEHERGETTYRKEKFIKLVSELSEEASDEPT